MPTATLSRLERCSIWLAPASPGKSLRLAKGYIRNTQIAEEWQTHRVTGAGSWHDLTHDLAAVALALGGIPPASLQG
jgi:hypothetical protein